MIKELVSIIVPIYKVEKYLKKCIESLIKQTYNNIEIFLVDDGSPDNCGKICDDFSKIDSRIKVTHKENGGYGSVLEYSINHILGKYFLICDPDDWLNENAVEELYNCMISNNVDFVIGRKKLVYIDGHEDTDRQEFEILKPNDKYDDLTKFLAIPCSPHAKLYKTKKCKDIKFPKKINNTDFLLYYVYLSKITSAYYLDKELANYFIDRPGNSFNEDTIITEKSLKSNAIVTEETSNQLNKNSKLYPNVVISLFIRSCNYLGLMEKSKLQNIEYKNIFYSVISYTKKYRKYLSKYLIKTTISKNKALFKIIIYKMCLNKFLRKPGIFILSKIK